MLVAETRVLVLNRSYFPVGVCTVKEAFKLICQYVNDDPNQGPLAHILDAKLQPYDFASWAELEVEEGMDSIGLVNKRIRVPRLIRLITFNKVPNTVVKFSRQNVMTRDSFTCCYCNKRKHISNLSLDHVQPKSKGGKTSWDNIVTACMQCNQVKGDRTPEQAGMELLRKPFRPTWGHLHASLGRGKIYPEWEPWLSNTKYLTTMEFSKK